MRGLDTSICFDIMGIPGDIINLVRDEVSGEKLVTSNYNIPTKLELIYGVTMFLSFLHSMCILQKK